MTTEPTTRRRGRVYQAIGPDGARYADFDVPPGKTVEVAEVRSTDPIDLDAYMEAVDELCLRIDAEGGKGYTVHGMARNVMKLRKAPHDH